MRAAWLGLQLQEHTLTLGGLPEAGRSASSVLAPAVLMPPGAWRASAHCSKGVPAAGRRLALQLRFSSGPGRSIAGRCQRCCRRRPPPQRQPCKCWSSSLLRACPAPRWDRLGRRVQQPFASPWRLHRRAPLPAPRLLRQSQQGWQPRQPSCRRGWAYPPRCAATPPTGPRTSDGPAGRQEPHTRRRHDIPGLIIEQTRQHTACVGSPSPATCASEYDYSSHEKA